MGGKKKKKTKQQLEAERIQREEEEKRLREEEERRKEEERKEKEEQDRLWKIACFKKRMLELKRLKSEQEHRIDFLESFENKLEAERDEYSKYQEWNAFIAEEKEMDSQNESKLNEAITSLVDRFSTKENLILDDNFTKNIRYSSFDPCILSIFDLKEKTNDDIEEENKQEKEEEINSNQNKEEEEERRKRELKYYIDTISERFYSYEPLLSTFDLISSLERKKGLFMKEKRNNDHDGHTRQSLSSSKRIVLDLFLTKRNDLLISIIKYADRLVNQKGELQIELSLKETIENADKLYPLHSNASSCLWGNYNDFKALKSKTISFKRLGLKCVLPKQVLQQGLVLNCNLLPTVPLDSMKHREQVGTVLDFKLLPTMSEPKVLPGTLWTIRCNHKQENTSKNMSHEQQQQQQQQLTSLPYPTSVYTKLVWTIPHHVIVHESFSIKRWNSVENVWEEEGIADVGYSQEKHQIHFSIQQTGFFSLFIPREVHFPFKRWYLKPINESNISLNDQERKINGCRFAFQTRDNLELSFHLRNEKATLMFSSIDENIESEQTLIPPTSSLTKTTASSKEDTILSTKEEEEEQEEEEQEEEQEKQEDTSLASSPSKSMHFGSTSTISLSENLSIQDRLSFLSNAWFSIPELLSLLDRCGIFLIPEDEDFLQVTPFCSVPSSLVEREQRQKNLFKLAPSEEKDHEDHEERDERNPYDLQLKELALEDFAYREMALLVASFEFSSSKWNLWLPGNTKAKASFLTRESAVFTTPLLPFTMNDDMMKSEYLSSSSSSGFDWESVLVEIDDMSESHHNALHAKYPESLKDEEKEEKEEKLDFSRIGFKCSLIYPSEESESFNTTPKLNEQEYTNEESDQFGTHSDLEAALRVFVENEEAMNRSHEANPLFQAATLDLLKMVRPLGFG